MKSTLAQLETDENALLMYIAGELSAADQKTIEARLEQDAALRAKLDELRSMSTSIQSTSGPGLAEADLARIVHETQLSLREFSALPKQASVEHPTSLPLPWWTYPLAAAASIVVAVSVFVANMEPGRTRPLNSPMSTRTPDLYGAAMAPQDFDSDLIAKAEQIADSLDKTDDLMAQMESPLFKADRELAALRESSDTLEDF